MKTDTYVWGTEEILWGYLPEHEFTIKILKPKPGREGCLSLQLHKEKSETWQVISGIGYAIYVTGDKVKSQFLNPGAFISLPAGTIHRLISLSKDFAVLEYSTLDAHAKDSSLPKDVIRLHCAHGREVVSLPGKEKIIQDCIAATEQILDNFEKSTQVLSQARR